MFIRTFAVVTVMLGAACDDDVPTASKLGMPGDPGYVEPSSSQVTDVELGELSGELSGAGILLKHYENPDAEPFLNLEYVGGSDGYSVQVFFWAQGKLPSTLDIATYRVESAYGENEGVRLEYTRPMSDGASDTRLAIAGKIAISETDDRLRIELSGLELDDPKKLGALAINEGKIVGSVADQCFIRASAAATAGGDPSEPVVVSNTDGGAAPRYEEDAKRKSVFCAALE